MSESGGGPRIGGDVGLDGGSLDRDDDPRRDDPRRDDPRRDSQRPDRQRRDHPRRDDPGCDGPRRDDPRRDGPRRDDPRREDPRCDDPRRDGERRDDPRRDGERRDDPRRDGRGTEDRSGDATATGGRIGDVERLRRLFGGDESAWIRGRLRTAYERGGALPERVALRRPTEAQREWVDRVFGRRPTRADSLSVSVRRLEAVLREAGLADDLVTALTILDGPLRDRRAEREAREAQWQRLHDAVQARVGDRAWLRRWLEGLVASGQLRRVAGGAPERARRLVEQALDVVDGFPFDGVALPELAARCAGDAHALDKGRDLGSLCVRAAAAFGGLHDWTSADAWRECWAAAGVICDELSTPVLTLGLDAPAASASLTDAMLHAHQAVGEPCLLSLRHLVRHPPTLRGFAGRDVFVCENPTVLSVAASRLGRACAPLVCTSGHLRAATRVLLRRLAAAGARLHVRADFDAAGLHIAAASLSLPGARPWRMDAEVYRRARPGPPLDPSALPDTPWAPGLAAAMRERGAAVHEESLLERLLADLRRAR